MVETTQKAVVAIPSELEQEKRAAHPRVTDRQAQLVAHLLHDGATVDEAAKRIGANRAWAYTTLRKQWVREYAQDMRDALLCGLGLRALATAGDLLGQAKSERLRAEIAMDLMNRAGVGDGPKQAPSVLIQFNLD